MSKQTKKQVNAATVAAGKVDAAIDQANTEVKALAEKYTTQVQGAVGKMQLDYALKARAIVNRVPDADVKPLISAFGRQRKSEANAVIYATDAALMAANELFPKTRKPGLQQMGRALQLVAVSIEDESAAKRYLSTGKKADFMEATGQKPEPAKPEPVQGSEDGEPEPEQRDVKRENPDVSEVGNLSRLNDLLPKLEEEMSEYGPECKKAMAAFKKAADALIKAAANG